MEKVEQLLGPIDAQLRKYPQVRQLEEKTQGKVRPSYVVVALGVVLFLFVLAGWLDELICNLVGFAYPAYASFVAVESSNKDDDTQWLVYWVVFALFSIIDCFADFVMSWFPFYFVVKFVFILWLWLPVTHGAALLYSKIRPFLGQPSRQAKNKTTDSVSGKVEEFLHSEQGEKLKKFGQAASDLLNSKKDA